MLMWSSVAASGFGDRLIQLAAEPLLGVKEAGASAAKIQAGIMFFFFLPYMLLTVVGGYLADRLPRKWIMLACDEGRGIVLLLAFFWVITRASTGDAIARDHVWFTFAGIKVYSVAKLYLILALTGCFAAIFNPARSSAVPEIVEPNHLQQANAVIAGIALISSLIGVAASGPIIDKSLSTGVLIGALAFLISGTFFAFMKVDKRERAVVKTLGPIALAREASRYLRQHAPVRYLVIMNVLFWAAAYVVNAAIAALVRTHYQVPIEKYLSFKTTLLALLGFGMLSGSIFVLWLRERRESGIIAMTALAIASLCMLGLATNRIYEIGLGLAFIIGISGGVALICIDTLTQAITPNHLRGRVFGFRALLNTTSGVAVNFAIWRLPEDQADQWMVPTLIALALILGTVSMTAVVRLLISGPMDSKLLNAVWRINRLFAFVWHRLTSRGNHMIPQDGAVLIAANHTAAIDPMLIQATVLRTIRWVMTTTYQFKIFNPLWKRQRPIALDPKSGNLGNLRTILRELKAGEMVGIFPEGHIQRDSRELQPFQAGLGMIAQRSGATIVPVWIADTPKSESMLMHFLRPSKSRVYYGEPYKADKNMTNEQVVEDLRQRMLRLAKLAEGQTQ